MIKPSSCSACGRNGAAAGSGPCGIGSRYAGGILDYQYLPLPHDLIERYKERQTEHDNSPRRRPLELDWDRFKAVGPGLARDLKRCVGLVSASSATKHGRHHALEPPVAWSSGT